jgi:hypothetical protein
MWVIQQGFEKSHKNVQGESSDAQTLPNTAIDSTRLMFKATFMQKQKTPITFFCPRSNC